MATAAQDLFDEANCYVCFGASTVEALKLALLARTLVALDPTADVSADALMSYGSCYRCYDASNVAIMELALLDQISQAA